jgi:hypothetical protein
MNIDRAKEILSETAWTHPADYGGHSPDGDYVIYARTRDSDIMANVNYDSIMETFEHDESVYDFRASHWACGWVEYIIVPAGSPDSVLTRAADILCALADYPSLNDDKLCEAEYEAFCEFWDGIGTGERLDYLKQSGDSIFAARASAGELYDRAQNTYHQITDSIR